MTTWRKYGLVFVSAGLIISGSLWYQRQGCHARGEDVAELMSATIERREIAYLIGDDTPSFSPNNISVTPMWSTVYNDILDAARTLALTNSGATLSYPARFGIYWLPKTETIDDGETICSYSAAWQVSEIVTNISGVPIYMYALTQPTNNCVDGVRVTAAYAINSEFTLRPDIAPSNFPVSIYFFNTNGSSAAWGTGSWWVDVGNGTNNVPFYSCEIWPVVEVTGIAGAGFSVSPDKLLTLKQSNDVEAATITSTRDSSATTYGSEIFKISRKGFDDAYFAATDYGGSTTNNALNVVSPQYSILEGTAVGPFQIIPRLPIEIGESNRVVITRLFGSGSMVLYRGTQENDLDFYIFKNSNAGQYYIRAETDADNRDDVMLYSITYLGETHYCTAIQNDNGTPDEMLIAPSFNKVSVGGSTEFNATIKRDPPSVLEYDQSLKKINLDQASNVLTNMYRTIALCPADYAVCSNKTTRVWGSSDSGGVSGVYDDPTDSAAEYWGTAGTMTLTSTQTNLDANVYLIGRCRRNVRYFKRKLSFVDTAAEDMFVTIWSYYGEFVGEYCEGIDLQYPSKYACESGLVSKVTVYCVISTHIDPDAFIPAMYHSVHENWTITGTAGSGWFSEDLGLGIDLSGRYPELVNTTGSKTHWPVYITDGVPPIVKAYKIYEIANPTNTVSFDFGIDALPAALPTARMESAYTYHEESVVDAINDSEDIWESDISLYASASVVVVEWAWTHMNPAAPYESDPYTPAWITANTNAP